MADIAWQPDVLAGFEQTTIDLTDEDDGELVATVVRRLGAAPSRTCVVYVHGYSDYFFQTHLAESYLERGIDFYAVDRRRCGRSIRPGNRVNYVDDLADYAVELGAAIAIATDVDGHDRVILHGHSEGGLVSSIFVADHPDPRIVALALNSPWLDVRLPLRQRIAWWISKRFGRFFRHRPVDAGMTAYVDSIHHHHRGEWDFDVSWKPRSGTVVYPGWARAVARGHDRVRDGLGIGVPILVQRSDRSSRHEGWDDELLCTDSVLDVDQIHRRAPDLGPDVTVQVIAGGMHDLVLSAAPVRAEVLERLHGWIAARVDLADR